MPRLVMTVSALALLPHGALAQDSPEIPAPPAAAQGIQYVSIADSQPDVLPQGRSQTEGTAPKTRNSGYASPRPAAYTRPVGQQVYTSKAYAAPAPQPAGGSAAAAPTRSGPMAAAHRTLRGVRVEARVGWDQSRNDGDSSDALLYGLGIGYDHEFGNSFVGGYAAIDWSDARTQNTVLVAGTPSETHVVSVDSGKDIELGIRAGYWLGDYVNVYGLLAHTRQSFDVFVDNQTAATTASRSVDQDGWRVGAGTEYHLPSGVYGKAEYRYSNYGDDPGVPGVDRDKHQLVTGVGIRF